MPKHYCMNPSHTSTCDEAQKICELILEMRKTNKYLTPDLVCEKCKYHSITKSEMLFEDLKHEDPEWKKHWKQMPEFIQEDAKPYAQIIFRFWRKENLDDFNKLIGQNLTVHSKYAEHPPQIKGKGRNQRWVDVLEPAENEPENSTMSESPFGGNNE